MVFHISRKEFKIIPVFIEWRGMEEAIIQKKNARLKLNLNLGSQILELKLTDPNTGDPIDVIQPFSHQGSFFGSGSFWMFPWVNRLESENIPTPSGFISIQAKHKDSLGSSIHGLIYDTPRKTTSVTPTQITIEPIEQLKLFPEFQETYTFVSEKELEIKLRFRNHSKIDQYFSFGYHPYLTLGKKLDELYLHTNLKNYTPLNDRLLPSSNLPLKEARELFNTNGSLNNLSFDHTFIGKREENLAYAGLVDLERKICVELVSYFSEDRVNLPFFQIYTPPDRNSIAIEPMSSTGNSFFIPNSGLYCLESGKEISSSFSIRMKKVY